jgi:hypothetical protein
MTRTRVLRIALVALLAIPACSTKAARSSARVDSRMITLEEMRSAGYQDALTTVQSLRPNWLNSRGASSITQQETIKVYLDGSLLGGPEYLSQITMRSISTIRFLDGLEATQRWGLDHGLGAIVVSTRRD